MLLNIVLSANMEALDTTWTLWDYLQQPYFQRALAAAVMAGIACALLGSAIGDRIRLRVAGLDRRCPFSCHIARGGGRVYDRGP